MKGELYPRRLTHFTKVSGLYSDIQGQRESLKNETGGLRTRLSGTRRSYWNLYVQDAYGSVIVSCSPTSLRDDQQYLDNGADIDADTVSIAPIPRSGINGTGIPD